MFGISKKRLLELRLARVNRLIEEQKELEDMRDKKRSNDIRNSITNLR